MQVSKEYNGDPDLEVLTKSLYRQPVHDVLFQKYTRFRNFGSFVD